MTVKSTGKTIVWLRNDLRIKDNPALYYAAQQGKVIPIWIDDQNEDNASRPGAASRCWLHQALASLDTALNGQLRLLRGSPEALISRLISETGATAVYWNRLYTPHAIQRDQKLKTALKQRDIEVQSFNGSLLWEPWTINKPDGSPYKVFTPYYKRGCMNAVPPPPPLPEPKLLNSRLISKRRTELDGTVPLDDLNLLPEHRWGQQILKHWQVSETGAHNALHTFVSERLADYSKGRDIPGQELTSMLSPYLRWGQISPRQIWYYAAQEATERHPDNLHKFQQELGWREFSYYQLFHNPQLSEHNLDKRFNHFHWLQDGSGLKCWQQGNTGFPIIDAGMRQLWQTGYMHNRVRMLVASFLVKNQLIHWHEGAHWFWDTLLDADLANNSASWQWVAGCGTDAAPYFRIFNPVVQGEKFDPRGEYVRYYLPELNQLPDKYIHRPWEAPQEILEKSALILGKDYPMPILDLKVTRQRAMDAFSRIKSSIK